VDLREFWTSFQGLGRRDFLGQRYDVYGKAGSIGIKVNDVLNFLVTLGRTRSMDVKRTPLLWESFGLFRACSIHGGMIYVVLC
jgi:hypothetical protein